MRFRLAGTFFQLSEDATNEVRRAILDDTSTGSQRIVSEGDALDGTLVLRILSDHVQIRDGTGEHSLWLSFTRGSGGAAETNSQDAASGLAGRFGVRQVGTNRWVFSREPLMQYYKELMDQPERLVRVFDSLKPMYTAQGKIDGYRLNVEGEGDFFEAVGLKENDSVRSVNSLPMTSRQRAEFFIRQFVANRANAFVIEVERDGSRQKVVYEMR